MFFSSATFSPSHRPDCCAYFRRGLCRIACIALLFLMTGCGLQSKIIKKRHWDLNETIRQTTNEQLLLNLVRLRYDESPYFLQISSITTSFSAGGNLGVGGTFPDTGDDVYRVDAGISYSETPTVTWAIPDSRDFLGRLYAPIGADQISVLSLSGYNLVDVFRVGVSRINLLQNREFDIAAGEVLPKSYDAFVEALNLIEALRRDDLLDLSFSLTSSFGGPSFPMEKLDMRAISSGVSNNLYYIERPENPGDLVPRTLGTALFIRFRLESDNDPRAQRLRDLLKLHPDKYSFPITNTSNASPEGLRTESSRLSTLFDPDVRVQHIMLNNRSVMEILRFVAACVQVPEKDVEKGVVRKRDVKLDEYLKVLYSKYEPRNAWLKVKYQGRWFYIPDNDLNARSSFSLISALFSSVVGEVPGAKPVLTLPVN